MRDLAERAYFVLCLALGRLLRSATYSKAQLVSQDGERLVRKRRLFYAPLLVWLGGPLVTILDTGVRVLGQREWEERERRMYWLLHGASVRIEEDGTLVLPCLSGETLATLLEDPTLQDPVRDRIIAQAAAALAELHRLGFSHGDAMAENVLVDRDSETARWFDFETLHASSRPAAWRRADDWRSLAATCLLRIAPERHAEVLRTILDACGDEEAIRFVAESFTVLRRPLAFHLAQARLSLRSFREAGRLLTDRLGEQPAHRG